MFAIWKTSADVTATVKRRRHRHRIGNRAATHRSNEKPQTIQSANRKLYNQKHELSLNFSLDVLEKPMPTVEGAEANDATSSSSFCADAPLPNTTLPLPTGAARL